ncbi:hypothetical protein DITRI_Ditri10aG0084400 [Diplodiscus trichospermus]
MLTVSGRITLVKSFLASLPIYYMSLFHLPASIKMKLYKIQRRFMWDGSLESRKIHWVDWSSVCKPKVMGGLGIIDVKLKNKAQLNKWVWRYGEESGTMWRKLIIEKYVREADPLIPIVDNYRHFSTIWKNITRPFSCYG